MSLSVSDVSVVTVNWNGRHHLETLLPSLLSLQAGEIILVDNGSSDGSQEFVRKRYPAVKVLQNDTNRGFCEPNNLAARQARGRYLAMINNDMRADPGWLRQALTRFREGVACVGSRILDWEGERVDFNGSSLQYLGYAVQRDVGALAQELSHAESILFACGGAMIVDREIFLRVGGLDEVFFAIYEDVDFGWRLWLAGYEVLFAPDSLVFHRGHGTFQAHRNEKMRYLMHRNALLTVLKNYEEETFRKILPVAIVMAIKRAVLFSGIKKEQFYLWADSEARVQGPDSAGGHQLLDALNHIVALDDVLDLLPQIFAARQRIQSLRRRPDSEIFGLFVDPFRTIVSDPEYLAEESRTLEAFGLAELFRPLACPAPPDVTGLKEQRIDLLREEVAALQWQTGRFLRHPVNRRKASISEFLQVWRRSGFGEAWRRFMEHVDRGL
jgi:GT2 family glycosyltransferase